MVMWRIVSGGGAVLCCLRRRVFLGARRAYGQESPASLLFRLCGAFSVIGFHQVTANPKNLGPCSFSSFLFG